MSGSLSVVAFEGELNSIVREFLDFGGFDKTFQTFDAELQQKGKPLASPDVKSLSDQKLIAAQNEMMQLFHKGKRKVFFNMWEENLPLTLRDGDSVAQKLEFYLNIYFAIYPIKFAKGQTEAEKNMAEFKQFLETRGATLSQTTEFLPFYALPFVPNAKGHPSYKELFTDSWIKDLEVRLEKFLTLALKSTPQPRLFDLYRGVSSDGKGHYVQVQQLQQQLMEAEKKTMSYIKRHNKVQADYHNLIGITADLVDALEQTVQGKTDLMPFSGGGRKSRKEPPTHKKLLTTPEYLQQLCSRLFNSHLGTSVDLTRPGTAGDALRQSIAPHHHHQDQEPDSLTPLDYSKVKHDLANADDRRKSLLLQALRLRLTQSSAPIRDTTLAGYIQHDLLGCAQAGPHREAVLLLLTSTDPISKQSAARLFNAFASLCAGRTYLAQNQDLFKGLIDNLRSEDKDSITREMVLGALQKLSLRRNLQSAMIENGLIEWLVKVLEDNDSLSDYTLEYSVALLMNLCLRTTGKKRCVGSADQTLKVLSDLLGHENTEIRPYVNGALYSILAIPSIREEAKAMGMEEILRCFIKDDQPDMNRQIDFIIKQLNSSEAVDEYESDDEEEEEDEEDQDAMEMDLDKDESLRPEGNELSGERLLMTEYLAVPGASAKPRRKEKSVYGKFNIKDVVSARFEPLQRPVTPSQRKAAEAGIPTINGIRPETASKDLVRPPTRSGSRPNTQESVREPTSSRPESSQSAKGKAASKTAETNLSTPVAVEYSKAFGSRPKIPRTPDPKSQKRPTSRGSISSMPPQPQFSESGPRPSSAGKSGNGSVSPRKASAGSHGRGGVGDVKS